MTPASSRVRVYLPSTVAALLRLDRAHVLVTGGIGHAVTTGLRRQDPDGDLDDWEFQAFAGAADASLSLLSAEDPSPRRVVVSADIESEGVDAVPDQGPAAVAVPAEVGWADVAAIHIDGIDAVDAVAEVLAGGPASALDDIALEWYAPQELADLLT